jgi:hypothetical protein
LACASSSCACAACMRRSELQVFARLQIHRLYAKANNRRTYRG